MTSPPHRVLSIDDDTRFTDILRLVFERSRIQFVAADCWPRAIEHLTSEEFGLIVVDDMLPGIDGFEMTRLIRADPHWAAVPIVMCGVVPGAARRFLDAGGDVHTLKPILPHRFVQLAADLLVRGRDLPGAQPADLVG